MISPKYVVAVGVISEAGTVSFLGTGFLVGEDKVITARHVIKGYTSGIVISPVDFDDYNTYQDTELNLYHCLNVEIVEDDPIKDLCVMKIIGNISLLSPLNLTSADEINVGDEVGVIGYPHCNENRKVVTFQTAKIGAKVLLSSSGIKCKHLILNLQSRPGQSGSLVFNLKNNYVIGVLIGAYADDSMGTVLVGSINPADLHQTTYVVSAEYIKDML
ncbi:S1 family peptidase [Providencia rettgeri]|uniref:S1 family peptidase n=1 Tax=Providencia rettgeri TaxID=587 RepID=UPI001E4EEAEB|nr:serine protease [Providencia rettgeri]UFK93464.1 serine protease [Providencia rettgeri]